MHRGHRGPLPCPLSIDMFLKRKFTVRQRKVFAHFIELLGLGELSPKSKHTKWANQLHNCLYSHICIHSDWHRKHLQWQLYIHQLISEDLVRLSFLSFLLPVASKWGLIKYRFFTHTYWGYWKGYKVGYSAYFINSTLLLVIFKYYSVNHSKTQASGLKLPLENNMIQYDMQKSQMHKPDNKTNSKSTDHLKPLTWSQ